LHDEGWKIIHIQRKNKVRHVLSLFFVKARGRFHKRSKEKENIRIHVDYCHFIEIYQRRCRLGDLEKKALENLPYYQVVYEEDLEDSECHQGVVNGVLDYLSLEHKKASSELQRINTQSFAESIINYDEFMEEVRRHGEIDLSDNPEYWL